MLGQMGRGKRRAEHQAERPAPGLPALPGPGAAHRCAGPPRRSGRRWSGSAPIRARSPRCWSIPSCAGSGSGARRATTSPRSGSAPGPHRLAVRLVPPGDQAGRGPRPAVRGRAAAVRPRARQRARPAGRRSRCGRSPGSRSRASPSAVYGVVRAMIAQLALFHSPDDVRISVCASPGPDALVGVDQVAAAQHAPDRGRRRRAGAPDGAEPAAARGACSAPTWPAGRRSRPAGRRRCPSHVVIVDGGQALADSRLGSDGVDGAVIIDVVPSAARRAGRDDRADPAPAASPPRAPRCSPGTGPAPRCARRSACPTRCRWPRPTRWPGSWRRCGPAPAARPTTRWPPTPTLTSLLGIAEPVRPRRAGAVAAAGAAQPAAGADRHRRRRPARSSWTSRSPRRAAWARTAWSSAPPARASPSCCARWCSAWP